MRCRRGAVSSHIMVLHCIALLIMILRVVLTQWDLDLLMINIFGGWAVVEGFVLHC